MGAKWSSSRSYKHREPPLPVLVTGLDDVGKTTFLYRIETDTFDDQLAYYGSSLFAYKTVRMWPLETGGRSKVRPLINHTWPEAAQAVIFVVDSTSDTSQITEMKEYIWHHHDNDNLLDKPLLFIANKQDLPNAMTAEELITKFELNRMREEHKWHVEAVSCVTGEGVKEAMNWLVETAGWVQPKPAIEQPINDALDDMKETLKAKNSPWKYFVKGWHSIKGVAP